MTFSKICVLSARMGGLFFVGILWFACGNAPKPPDQNSPDGGTADLASASSSDVPIGTFCITIDTDKKCVVSPVATRTVNQGNDSFEVKGMLPTGDMVYLEGTMPDGASLPRTANPGQLDFTIAGECKGTNCLGSRTDYAAYPCRYSTAETTAQQPNQTPVTVFQGTSVTIEAFSPNELIASINGTFQIPAFGCTECAGFGCNDSFAFTAMTPFAPPLKAVQLIAQVHVGF